VDITATTHSMKGLVKMLSIAVAAAVVAPIVVYLHMARKAPRAELICGKIVASLPFHALNGDIWAYFIVADKNENIHQAHKSGIWPVGMKACVEEAR
jgi:hypothetical protein